MKYNEDTIEIEMVVKLRGPGFMVKMLEDNIHNTLPESIEAGVNIALDRITEDKPFVTVEDIALDYQSAREVRT